MFSLMNKIAKDQTLQYILTMLDDVLQVVQRGLVEGVYYHWGTQSNLNHKNVDVY